MASIVQRIVNLLNSPKGRQAVERGQRELAKPENQAKLRRLAGKLRKGRS
ncbi:MAG TPA: hypothetical protein VFT95_16550 [Micromonosporaceae bacterium]|nr:hypothetical protein [Micromonosporaceae bacterium]